LLKFRAPATKREATRPEDYTDSEVLDRLIRHAEFAAEGIKALFGDML
jgi:hypothetical protein